MSVCVSVVCVLAKVVQSGDIRGFLLQATGHTYHTGHMPICSEWFKTMQNVLSIDPRGTTIVWYKMHLPALHIKCPYVCE